MFSLFENKKLTGAALRNAETGAAFCSAYRLTFIRLSGKHCSNIVQEIEGNHGQRGKQAIVKSKTMLIKPNKVLIGKAD